MNLRIGFAVLLAVGFSLPALTPAKAQVSPMCGGMTPEICDELYKGCAEAWASNESDCAAAANRYANAVYDACAAINSGDDDGFSEADQRRCRQKYDRAYTEKYDPCMKPVDSTYLECKLTVDALCRDAYSGGGGGYG